MVREINVFLRGIVQRPSLTKFNVMYIPEQYTLFHFGIENIMQFVLVMLYKVKVTGSIGTDMVNDVMECIRFS